MDSIASYSLGFFNNDPSENTKVIARSLKNRILSGICIALSLLTMVPLISIIFLLLKKGLPLLGLNIFTELPPAAGMAGGGFGNAIIGTLAMVGIGLAISGPAGILSAIYINEYSPASRLAQAVRMVAKLLTGIPSIICGVFAFAVVVMATGTFSAYAGGLALAVLMLPTIILTSEQALMGVQSAYREAAYGLGATRFQAIARVVLPDAFPAIMTGVMLAVARAAGETAPLIFTALFSQFWAKSLNEPTASLSVLIYNFSTVPFPHQIAMAWTASLVLVAFVTLANITAQTIFSRRH
ncbi:MAG: phosphate ABC transporter, permease protein PstA [Spartobacteria bacterium AMD-G4]|nr:MAG: phosphate ABC transporter, permease protein PstA [Spartobacteria bacterium AMD-G4]